MEVAHIPLSSLKPTKSDKPEMVMAAVAAAWALGIAPELMGAGLRTFESTPQYKTY
jgi:cyanophycin synthetase